MYVRKLFYRSEHLDKILQVHNRQIMNLGELEKQVVRQNNLRILFAGYIREMTIWFPKSSDILKPNMLKYYDGLKKLEIFFDRLGWSSRVFSPEILLIGRKQGDSK
jgi:hypothetical protein